MMVYRRLPIFVLIILLAASFLGSANLQVSAQVPATTVTTAARKKPKAVSLRASYKLAAAKATGTYSASGYLVMTPGAKPYYSPDYSSANLGFDSGQQNVADTSVIITGGGGTGATAEALVSGVTGLTLQSGGAGYTSAPTVTFLGGGGTGAAATANISNGVVVSLTLTSGGSGYLIPPTVVLMGGGVPAPPAVATASIAPGTITGIVVTNPGSGYTSAPTVTIKGSGKAAIAIPVVSSGQVTGIVVTNPGFGYGLGVNNPPSSGIVTNSTVP